MAFVEVADCNREIRKIDFAINRLFLIAFSIYCIVPTFHKQSPSLENKQKKLAFIILVQTDKEILFCHVWWQFFHKVD